MVNRTALRPEHRPLQFRAAEIRQGQTQSAPSLPRKTTRFPAKNRDYNFKALKGGTNLP
jgi:hypothetical protein